jgi:hypothetical protein
MYDALSADYRVEQTENADRTKLLQLLDDVSIVAADRDEGECLAVKCAQDAEICFTKPDLFFRATGQ